MDNRDCGGRNRRLAGLLVTAFVAAAPTAASAQAFESLGTRAMGMAGAFVAVADDATAAYWNPSGLPTGAFLSLLVDRTNGQTRLDPNRADAPGADDTGTIVGMSTSTSAFSYYRLRINQIDRAARSPDPHDPIRGGNRGDPVLRSLVTDNVGVSGAQLVYPGVSLGTTLRYVRGSFGVGAGDPGLSTTAWLEAADGLSRQSENEVDLDVGLKAGGERLQVGLVARNLLEPTFGGPDGPRVRLERQYRAGVAFRPGHGLVIAADLDLSALETVNGSRRNVAIGAEQWFGLWLAIRAGARVDLEDEDGDRRPVGAFGASVAITSGVYVDAQVTRGRDGIEQGWSLAGRVGF